MTDWGLDDDTRKAVRAQVLSGPSNPLWAHALELERLNGQIHTLRERLQQAADAQGAVMAQLEDLPKGEAIAVLQDCIKELEGWPDGTG